MLPFPMNDDTITADPGERDRVLTLLVSAPDRPGLVAGVAGTLFEHDANILEADQHDDAGSRMFFQRIRFAIRAAGVAPLAAAMEELAARLGLDWSMRDRAQIRGWPSWCPARTTACTTC